MLKFIILYTYVFFFETVPSSSDSEQNWCEEEQSSDDSEVLSQVYVLYVLPRRYN